ncbi:MAG: tRNA (N6-threonylcarbamoyladenosine(37)-N6)-methyltransferase TrmO [Terriglobia bacterium]|jgi:tRNA-Thr(GGU) m(6)t(6)A37 methyltransferase TsaA
MQIKPIGIIRSPFREATGTPIQPRAAEGVEGTVEVFDEFVPGLRDLEDFERIWLLYWFDRARFEECDLVVKPYLDNTAHGVFATRAPARPNPTSECRIMAGTVCRCGLQRTWLSSARVPNLPC